MFFYALYYDDAKLNIILRILKRILLVFLVTLASASRNYRSESELYGQTFIKTRSYVKKTDRGILLIFLF